MLLADLPAAGSGPVDRVPMTALESLPLDGIPRYWTSAAQSAATAGGCWRTPAPTWSRWNSQPAGDELRRQDPFAGGRSDPERSLTFAYYHANKRGIVLDYRRAETLGMLAELGANADVVLLTPPVTGFDPKARELSWAAPDAVVCAVTPFGSAHRPLPHLARHPPHLLRARRRDVLAGTA